VLRMEAVLNRLNSQREVLKGIEFVTNAFLPVVDLTLAKPMPLPELGGAP